MLKRPSKDVQLATALCDRARAAVRTVENAADRGGALVVLLRAGTAGTAAVIGRTAEGLPDYESPVRPVALEARLAELAADFKTEALTRCSRQQAALVMGLFERQAIKLAVLIDPDRMIASLSALNGRTAPVCLAVVQVQETAH